MKKSLFLLLFLSLSYNAPSFSQTNFNYSVELVPVVIEDLPGLQSYAFAQHDGKWLIIGGRKEGIHGRRPFEAFTPNFNNTDIVVIDPLKKLFWTSSLNSLPTNLKEQLQSTNMNFYQDGESLFIIGGYSFSESQQNHVTFPFLTSVNVPGLIQSIISESNISSHFTQITDDRFALTGGSLNKIHDTFYLVGGHKFEGRYNPHGPNHGPGFVQEYSNSIRTFKLSQDNSEIKMSDFKEQIDEVHLRRRDYNLIPEIDADGNPSLTISSGVFQHTADFPFLHPVEITENGFQPITEFNQYLSNYHSAFVSLFDEELREMHTLFFGGISRFNFKEGKLTQDNQVPFVNTISRLSRNSDGKYFEYVHKETMPGLKGSGAEFFINPNTPHFSNEIIKLSNSSPNNLLLGHIYGGITSETENPFNNYQSNTTSAHNGIYEVRLVKSDKDNSSLIDGKNPYSLKAESVSSNQIQLSFDLNMALKTNYFITNSEGRIIDSGVNTKTKMGENTQVLTLEESFKGQQITVTVVIDNKFYISDTVLMN